MRSQYDIEGRLADVIAAVTVMAAAKESEGSLKMWANRLSRPGDPAAIDQSAEYWKAVFNDHREFFLVYEWQNEEKAALRMRYANKTIDRATGQPPCQPPIVDTATAWRSHESAAGGDSNKRPRQHGDQPAPSDPRAESRRTFLLPDIRTRGAGADRRAPRRADLGRPEADRVAYNVGAGRTGDRHRVCAGWPYRYQFLSTAAANGGGSAIAAARLVSAGSIRTRRTSWSDHFDAEFCRFSIVMAFFDSFDMVEKCCPPSAAPPEPFSTGRSSISPRRPVSA